MAAPPSTTGHEATGHRCGGAGYGRSSDVEIQPSSGLFIPDMLILMFSLQPNACATFNFLCHEGRVTGAALIPPPGEIILPSLGQAAE